MTTKTKILLIAAAVLLIGGAVTAFVLKPWGYKMETNY
jgi:capsular polysaccharide biosynthesis protein